MVTQEQVDQITAVLQGKKSKEEAKAAAIGLDPNSNKSKKKKKKNKIQVEIKQDDIPFSEQVKTEQSNQAILEGKATAKDILERGSVELTKENIDILRQRVAVSEQVRREIAREKTNEGLARNARAAKTFEELSQPQYSQEVQTTQEINPNTGRPYGRVEEFKPTLSQRYNRAIEQASQSNSVNKKILAGYVDVAYGGVLAAKDIGVGYWRLATQPVQSIKDTYNFITNPREVAQAGASAGAVIKERPGIAVGYVAANIAAPKATTKAAQKAVGFVEEAARTTKALGRSKKGAVFRGSRSSYAGERVSPVSNVQKSKQARNQYYDPKKTILPNKIIERSGRANVDSRMIEKTGFNQARVVVTKKTPRSQNQITKKSVAEIDFGKQQIQVSQQVQFGQGSAKTPRQGLGRRPASQVSTPKTNLANAPLSDSQYVLVQRQTQTLNSKAIKRQARRANDPQFIQKQRNKEIKKAAKKQAQQLLFAEARKTGVLKYEKNIFEKRSKNRTQLEANNERLKIRAFKKAAKAAAKAQLESVPSKFVSNEILKYDTAQVFAKKTKNARELRVQEIKARLRKESQKRIAEKRNKLETPLPQDFFNQGSQSTALARRETGQIKPQPQFKGQIDRLSPNSQLPATANRVSNQRGTIVDIEFTNVVDEVQIIKPKLTKAIKVQSVPKTQTKVKAGTLVRAAVRASTLNKAALRQDLLTKADTKLALKTRTKTAVKTKALTDTLTKAKTKVIGGLVQVQVLTPKYDTIQITNQKNDQRLKRPKRPTPGKPTPKDPEATIFVPRIRAPNPKPPKKPPQKQPPIIPKLPFIKPLKPRQGKFELFNVYTRKKGRIVKVNAQPLSQGKAKLLGQKIVGSTARASFKLMSAGFAYGKEEPARATSRQYKQNKKGWFVELPKYRIDTATEKKEIKRKSSIFSATNIKKKMKGSFWK